jgi:integrase
LLPVTRSKTKASIRRIHLSDKAKAILKARLERFDGDFLFPQNDKDGTGPIKVLDVQHRKALGAPGFKFRLYDCRTTFATRALESGTDLLTLAAFPGHANLKTVSRYAQPSGERRAEALRQTSKPRQKQSKRAKSLHSLILRLFQRPEKRGKYTYTNSLR